MTIGGRVIQPFFISEADVEDQGWIVTFMLYVSGGGPSAGYISSSFFGGVCPCVLLEWAANGTHNVERVQVL